MDFRLRFVDPKPRQILFSNKFPKENLPNAIKKALYHLENLILQGGDINSYQGKGLIFHHDTSGKKRQKRTDLLWADWGILHFHLNDLPILKGNYFSERSINSDWLLFCIVREDFIAFIDVRPHGDDNVFSNPELIEIVCQSWPKLMKRHVLNGIAPGEALTPGEIADMRKGGVMGLLTVGEKVYIPLGRGISTASTSNKVIDNIDRIHEYVRELSKIVCDPQDQFQKESRAAGVKDPSFELCITLKGMAVYEINSTLFWLLPQKKQMMQGFLADLNDLMAPEWVLTRLQAYIRKKHPS